MNNEFKVSAMNIKYIEATPCLSGEYGIGHSYDDNNIETPWLFDSYKEAKAEIDDEIKRYQQEIKHGERDSDDEYDGVIFACELIGEIIILYDPETMNEVCRGNWKSMAGIE